MEHPPLRTLNQRDHAVTTNAQAHMDKKNLNNYEND